jgi:hypothetical protein
MRRRFSLYTLALGAGVVFLGACKDKNLEITNPNAGDTKRVLATPNDAENLLGTYFKRWSVGFYGGGNVGQAPPTTFEGMANVMSLQNFSSLANNCQNIRTPFSGAANVNTPGNPCAGEQYNPYAVEGEVERVASNFLGVVDGFGTFTKAQIARDKAFAEFLRGMAIGHLALFYDSVAVVTKGMDPLDKGNLVGYKEAMDSALAAFQRAIDNTNAAVAAGGFSLPGTWVPSPTVFNSTEFIKMVRSYRARFRASVARTPAERAAADWPAIIADAQNGFTADHLLSMDATNGPFSGWKRQYDPGGSSWHQMPPFIIGMGDVSGNYEAWLATALSARGAGNVGFFMVSPDLRFPQGATRAAQQADFKIQDCEINGGQVTGVGLAASCKRYFVNRTLSDQLTGAGWGWSNYDFVRFHWFYSKGAAGSPRTGDLAFFTKPELDMLQAEGLIRTGAYASAAALINLTRVKNGLPAITAFDNTSPVPGAANCVPRIPAPPSFTSTTCGNMFEAMKWEKRMETAYVATSSWFLDSRGWGDLPEGTALFWPVPFQELQVRGYALNQIYGAGPGVGNAPNSVAAKSTYGW